MQTYIGRWNCRYRVLDAQPLAALAVEAIERRVRPRVAEAYEASLEAALGKDPAVYVLRRVRVSLWMRSGDVPDEAALARGWTARIGEEIVRGLTTHADPSNFVRFDDEACYVAHFIADLLNDLAWQRWCYGAFSKFRLASKPEAILAILTENSKQLPAIFRYLAGLGCLKAALDLLDAKAAATLWRESVAPCRSEPVRGQFHVFARAALAIMAALELWSAGPIDETQLLDAYLATQPQLPDWTDRRSLAFAVWNIFRFAARRGYIAANRVTGESWTARFAQMAASLDWLDVKWLEQALAGWSQEAAGERPLSTRPGGLTGTATPNQRRLLERLRQILFAGAIGLDRRDPDSEGNAIRLFAALSAAEPEIASHPATAPIISLLLSCWKAILRLKDPLSAVQQIRSGRSSALWTGLPGTSGESLRGAAALGEPAADVLQELLAGNPIRLASPAEPTMETECAGLFLLLRGITEARVPQMIARHYSGRMEPILLALGLQWAGAAAVRAGAPDPGLMLWCGLQDEPKAIADVLAELDPAGSESLLAAVVRLMRDRSALDPGLPIAADIPQDWTAALSEAWPPTVPLLPPLVQTGVHLLRLWARWLRGVSHSGIPYLLRNLVRRRGRIEAHSNEIRVTMRPAPLDVVLQMSGYLGETPDIGWLGDRRVVFRIERSSP